MEDRSQGCEPHEEDSLVGESKFFTEAPPMPVALFLLAQFMLWVLQDPCDSNIFFEKEGKL
jgi:hypothetical protein